MGTSGAYGGSPGWNRVTEETEQWLEGNTGGGNGGDDRPADPLPPTPPPDTPEKPPAIPQPPSIPPTVASIISALSHAFTTGGGGIGGDGGGGGGGGRIGGGRSLGRASRVGGRALGGAYGARTATAGTLGELGLDLGELAGLSRYQQAQRILDAAIGPRGDVLESELRKANAEIVLWALMEEVEPTPVQLVNRWVVEYVWEVWITESGPALQGYFPSGSDRVRAEQEMRAALEAVVAAHSLPDDRPLTTADFATAIDGALSSLRRISGSIV